MSMRTDQEINEIIQQAFKPLRCVAEIWDYGEKIRFRVYRPDDRPLIQYSELTMREAHADRCNWCKQHGKQFCKDLVSLDE